MKHAREIKVGILAAVCVFLLFFGLNFLKGVNIFSPTNGYHGVYYNLHGLEEQAAVYICGHKVGQVDKIHYDFTRDSAFTIDISIAKDIALPVGTQMALVSDVGRSARWNGYRTPIPLLRCRRRIIKRNAAVHHCSRQLSAYHLRTRTDGERARRFAGAY